MNEPNPSGRRDTLSSEDQAKFDARVAELRLAMDDQFRTADYDLVIAMAGVSDASGHLKMALGKIHECTDRGDCSAAAALGYSDVSTAYVYLQRKLGALQIFKIEKMI